MSKYGARNILTKSVDLRPASLLIHSVDESQVERLNNRLRVSIAMVLLLLYFWCSRVSVEKEGLAKNVKWFRAIGRQTCCMRGYKMI